MAEPIMKAEMLYLVQCQISMREEMLDEAEAMPDDIRAIIEEAQNGWRAIHSLIEKHGGNDG